MRTIVSCAVGRPVTPEDGLGMVGHVALPRGALVLSVGMDDASPVMYALVDTDEPSIVRHFHAFRTDVWIPEKPVLSYVGTFELDGNAWHLFEEKDIPL